MPRRLFAGLLILAAPFFFLSVSVAQGPARPPSAERNEQQSEQPPAPVLKVTVRDGLLSVELADAEFGAVMKSIAAKAGIRIDVTGDVAGKVVTTRFRNFDIEDAITRLLSYVADKQSFFSYDEKGLLSRVEIFGTSSSASKARPPSPSKPAERKPAAAASPQPAAATAPQPAVQKNPPATKRIIPDKRQTGKVSEPTIDAPEGKKATETPDDAGFEDDGAAFPSEKFPDYIPPKSR